MIRKKLTAEEALAELNRVDKLLEESPTTIYETVTVQGRSNPGLAEKLHQENVHLRWALDAIRRAYDPAEGCLPNCACMQTDGDDDCDCGYCEATDDLLDFVKDALSPEYHGNNE